MLELLTSRPLNKDYFDRQFFPSDELYICGDIVCDTAFHSPDGYSKTCPRCGNSNTSSLKDILARRRKANGRMIKKAQKRFEDNIAFYKRYAEARGTEEGEEVLYNWGGVL